MIIELNGLYIQNIKNPSLIAYIPEDNPKNVHKPKITERAITAWFYNRGYVNEEVSFDEFKDYALITKEQFEKLRQFDLNLGLSESNYKLIKEEKNGLISKLLNFKFS